MPSLKYLFSESLWEAKQFFKNPRKIHAVFPALTIFAFWRIIFEYQVVIHYVPNENAFALRMFSFFTVVFAFTICYLGSGLVKRSKPRFWLAKYLFTIGLCVIPIEFFSLFALDRAVLDTLIGFVRLILLVAVTESIAGFLIVKVQKRTQELESHQKSLVLAEEKFRSLVSAHLHDNLQARLVSIGIQLNQISSSVNPEGAQQIRSVIDEIENIRAQDVREFGRGITPNFQVDGLEVSLERLFSQYKDVITCELHNLADFEPGNQNSHNYLLGVYRVVEQSLLNSLVHGRATEFDVYTNSSSNEVKLKITNNGDLYKAHSATQGHGFAVIDAWMTKFDGSWEISNHEEKVVTEFRWKI